MAAPLQPGHARHIGSSCCPADLLEEVRRREKALGVEVDWSVDAMLQSEALSGAQQSVATEFAIHMLGLDICADTIIGNAMKRGVSGGQKKRVTTGARILEMLLALGHATHDLIGGRCCYPAGAHA